MLTALDHFVIAVRDLNTAQRSYSRLLGRAATWRGEHPALGTENALFRLGNTYLELLAPAPDANGEGVFALAFATPDADSFRVHAEAHGLAPSAVQPGLGRDSDSGAFRKWRNVMLDRARTHGLQLFAIEHLSPAELLPLSPATDEHAGATVDSVDHLVVVTPDAERAKALYGDALGIRLGLDKEFPWGARQQFFRLGHFTLEVVSSLKADAPRSGPDRPGGVAYRVADAPAAHARLSAAGFDLTPCNPGRKPGTFVFTVKSETCGVPTLMIQPAVSERRPG
jgi:catechol 2,3-dioxygenase-like lactoylglutathione lyase family enzyme